MMTVKEFYKDGNHIFNQNVLNIYDDLFIDTVENTKLILNHEFLKKYGSLYLVEDTIQEINESVSIVFLKNKKYLEGMKQSLEKEFDPFVDIYEKVKTTNDLKENTTIDDDVYSHNILNNLSTSTTSRNTYDDDILHTTDKIVDESDDDNTTNTTTNTESEKKNTGTIEVERTVEHVNDYEKTLSLYYETRKVQFYDFILNEVFKDLCLALYI